VELAFCFAGKISVVGFPGRLLSYTFTFTAALQHLEIGVRVQLSANYVIQQFNSSAFELCWNIPTQ